ncbi:MAG: T9SS type A sorting domain-containing protein [bacterium]
MGKIITIFILLFMISTVAKPQTWQSCTIGIEDESIQSLAVIGQRIFAGTRSGCIYVTYDNGESWHITDAINSIPSTFVVYGNNILLGTYGKGLMKSLNGGTVWIPLDSDSAVKIISNIEVVADKLFVFAAEPEKGNMNGRISRSDDGGKTWVPVLKGKSYNRLLSLSSIGTTVFVSTTQCDVFRSDNFGDNWTNVGIDLPDKNIFQLKAQGTNLLAGSEETRFFISSDLGLTWRNANKGFPDDNVSAIAVNGSNIFVGTAGSGVYLSTDNGDSWNDFNDTLWNHHIQARCLVANDEYAFCSTGGYFGLYRKDITKLISPVADESKEGFEIYPNPAKDYITVSFKPSEGFEPSEGSAFHIYNTLGELVLSESIHPMTSSHRMNIESLPKGMYFVRNGGEVIKFTKY